MRPPLIFLVFSLSLFITSNARKDYFTGFVIKLAIETALNQVRKTGYIVLLKDFSLHIPKVFDKIIVGSIGVKNLTLYGLSTLNYNDTVNVDKEIENNVTVTTYNVDINATFDKLGLHTVYQSDLGVISSLPIYGNGEIQLEVKDVEVKVNVTLNDRNRLKIQDITLELSFRSSNESYITGFWNNIRVSKFLTKVINTAEKIIAVFYCYNKRCLECIIGRIIHFITNIILNNENVRYRRCHCFEENRILEKLEDTIESWPNGNITQIIYKQLEEPKKIRELLKIGKHILEVILKYENNLAKIFQ